MRPLLALRLADLDAFFYEDGVKHLLDQAVDIIPPPEVIATNSLIFRSLPKIKQCPLS
jgi:hypothetical protein